MSQVEGRRTGKQVVNSRLPAPIIGWKSEGVDSSLDLFFLGRWPHLFSLEWLGLSGMGCMVPQSFAARGYQSFQEFWAITGDPWYLGY
jgi:hypothetical protein